MIFIIILLIIVIFYFFQIEKEYDEQNKLIIKPSKIEKGTPQYSSVYRTEKDTIMIDECQTDSDCNSKYGGNKCNSGICDCYSGSGYQCMKGPTHYMDPRLLKTDEEKKEYAKNIKADFTLIDYINWLKFNKDNLTEFIDKYYLDLYNQSPSNLTDDHLKKRKEKLNNVNVIPVVKTAELSDIKFDKEVRKFIIDEKKYKQSGMEDKRDKNVNFILEAVMKEKSVLDKMAYNLNLPGIKDVKVGFNQMSQYNKLLPEGLDKLVNEYLDVPLQINEM